MANDTLVDNCEKVYKRVFTGYHEEAQLPVATIANSDTTAIARTFAHAVIWPSISSAFLQSIPQAMGGTSIP